MSRELNWRIDGPEAIIAEARAKAAARDGNSHQPRFADMSSAQRSASLDNMVRQIEVLTAAQNDHAARIFTLSTHVNELSDQLAALESTFVGQRGLKARILWLAYGK